VLDAEVDAELASYGLKGLTVVARFERPPGKFAGRGPAVPVLTVKHGKYRVLHSPSAVGVQLHHVFAGKAGGAGKPQHQPFIQCAPGVGIAKHGPLRHARRRLFHVKHVKDGARLRPGHPNDRHARPPGGRGWSKNRFCGRAVHHCRGPFCRIDCLVRLVSLTTPRCRRFLPQARRPPPWISTSTKRL